MKEIELNPDGTFPRKYAKAQYVTYTATTSFNPDWKPEPKKPKTWKGRRKEVKDFIVYLWIMWCLVSGSLLLLWQVIRVIVWIIKKF